MSSYVSQPRRRKQSLTSQAAAPIPRPSPRPPSSTSSSIKKRIPADLLQPPKIDTPSDAAVSTFSAFLFLLLAHSAAAIYSPIQDCDEVFNYWEPTHYLTNGYGFQTWEYSPEFAIRSWAYVALHATVIFLRRLLLVPFSKVARFYFLRIVLGAVCALCEARLFKKTSRVFGGRVGFVMLVVLVSSPGVFHASVAYLPSSFSMYTTALGMASFMDWSGGPRTAPGIGWIVSGAVLGWPFAAAMLAAPMLEELALAVIGQEYLPLAERIMHGTVRSLVVLAAQMGLDAFFYRMLTCVPFNIVWYNVLAATRGRGPNIFGTEPWHFYLRNLLINFNLWFALALLALPLRVLHSYTIGSSPATKQLWIRDCTFLAPFYLWLGLFSLQPHKEERFMYPAYPALAFNAAMSVHMLLNFAGVSSRRRRPASRIRLVVVGAALLVAVNLGLWRTVGTVTAYSAPLTIYAALRRPDMTHEHDTVCLGKEWHRFPSSYHLPKGVRAKFVKSEFDGLLPGEFSQANTGFGFFPGAWLVPVGMNDENKEDIGKYTRITHCNFLIDSTLPSAPPTELEPDYAADTQTWEKVACERFMDAGSTHLIARLGWVPDWTIVPERFRRRWGEYCLLRRRGRVEG